MLLIYSDNYRKIMEFKNSVYFFFHSGNRKIITEHKEYHPSVYFTHLFLRC